MERILVVDDESLMRDFIKETLTRMGYAVETAENGRMGVEMVRTQEFDLVISDIRMPDITGIDVLRAVKEHDADTSVIMMTAYGTVENAVEAMKLGAFDYITKPFTAEVIEAMVKKIFKYRNLESENKRLKKEITSNFGFENIIGKSARMQKVFEVIDAAVNSSATVFIQGPSGTGKELVARAIHYNGVRGDAPFIKTNCAALPEGLMESEFFGHEKGAFTGAIKARTGRFEAAHTGTILLDEISEMQPTLQAKLLRVLQEKEIERVGDHSSIGVDVRIIATTNREIKEEIRNGNFREDLYYRLNVIPIFLPALKERKKDIPILVDHFIEKYNKEHDRDIDGITSEGIELLMRLDWPGNVRELENRMERAVIMSKVKLLEPKHFVFEDDDFDAFKEYDSDDTNMTLYEMEKKLIFRTLKSLDNNRTKTADALGISVRTLRNKLNEYKEKGELDPLLMGQV